MTMGNAEIWLVILVLGLGTYLIRFSFLGLVGARPMPAWLLRLLRYTPVAVIPGIVAPLVLAPPATGGAFDPARGIAALVALGIALLTRNVLASVFGGAAALYSMLWLLG